MSTSSSDSHPGWGEADCAHRTPSFCEGEVETRTRGLRHHIWNPFTLWPPPEGVAGRPGPGSSGWGPFHPPTFPSLPLREQELLGTLGREGFRGPWVGVGHVALCS